MDKILIDQFKRDGFLHLKRYISEKSIFDINAAFKSSLKKENSTDSIFEDILSVEKDNHEKVYNAQKIVGSSFAFSKLLSEVRPDKIHTDIYGGKQTNINLVPLQLPVQFPDDERFDFKWHQECGSYKFRLLTFWFPTIGEVNEKNGSMAVIPSSHKDGERESHYVKKESGLNDWRVFLNSNDMDPIVIKAVPGDLIIFDDKLIHSSQPNSSNLPRQVGIFRSFDITNMPEVKPIFQEVNFLDDTFEK